MRVLQVSIGVVLIALFTGCNSSTSPNADLGGEDGVQIAMLVERMNDESRTLAQMKEIFASGTQIAKRNPYQGFQYSLKSKPAVNGTEATGTIVIEKHARGTPVEKEWTFVKEGDRWKIKSAPLP